MEDSEPLLRTKELPRLRRPIMLAAFAGWNDASQVATYALTTLLNMLPVKRFADFDPEPFFVFTETRPLIEIEPRGQRRLQWPSNAFYSARLQGSPRDVVILLGTEPELKWRTFTNLIVDLATRLQVSTLVTLGGLLADVPHTVESRLTGFATPPRAAAQLEGLGVASSSYEGPTGIVGVLHDAWRATRRPAISLWGSVPHYISASPNPQIAYALLLRVSSLLSVQLPLSRLEREVEGFKGRLDEALAENPEALEYVRELESQYARETAPAPGPELIAELEEFLRRRRPPQEG